MKIKATIIFVLKVTHNTSNNDQIQVSWKGIPIDPRLVKAVEGESNGPIFGIILAENYTEIAEDGGMSLKNLIDDMTGIGIKVTFRF